MTKSSRILTNVPLDDLKPYENNPRKNDMAVAKVAASLKEFTYAKVSVLVDENMTLLAGHTTLKAMRSLGWKTCPEVKQVFGWSEAEKRAYRIADNKLGELAEWDLELLAGELASLDDADFDVSLTGFDSLTPLAEDTLPSPLDLDDPALGGRDAVRIYHCPKCGFEFTVE
jgi:ParB-like chromosome segregation protein Spo0J